MQLTWVGKYEAAENLEQCALRFRKKALDVVKSQKVTQMLGPEAPTGNGASGAESDEVSFPMHEFSCSSLLFSEFSPFKKKKKRSGSKTLMKRVLGGGSSS
jgi:hypothetical protein